MRVYSVNYTSEFNGKSADVRRSIIDSIKNKSNPSWDDFVKLEVQLGNEMRNAPKTRIGALFSGEQDVSGYIIKTMLEIVNKVEPQPLIYPFSESNIMDIMCKPLRKGHYASTGVEWVYDDQKPAAEILKVIIKKMGRALDERDEAHIIREMIKRDYLLNSFEELIINPEERNWTKQINETGLVETITKELQCEYIHMRKLSTLIYGLGKATGLLIKEGSDVGYVYNSELIDSLLKTKGINEDHLRNNSCFLLQLVCKITSYADQKLEPYFISVILNDPHPRVKYWAMQGICHILARKGIKNTSLEKSLVNLIGHEDPQVVVAALTTVGKYLDRNDIQISLLNPSLSSQLSSAEPSVVFAALYAINSRLKRNAMDVWFLDKRLISLADHLNPEIRSIAFVAVRSFLRRDRQGIINNPLLKPTAIRYLEDANEIVRANAIDIFAEILFHEDKIRVTKNEIKTLLNTAYQ